MTEVKEKNKWESEREQERTETSSNSIAMYWCIYEGKVKFRERERKKVNGKGISFFIPSNSGWRRLDAILMLSIQTHSVLCGLCVPLWMLYWFSCLSQLSQQDLFRTYAFDSKMHPLPKIEREYEKKNIIITTLFVIIRDFRANKCK